jgi:hypothetical protein
MDLNEIFQNIAKQMLLDFDKGRMLSRHPGIRGDSAESIVRNFLRQYLPSNLEISSGQIFDTNGRISNQLDIIITDKRSTPILFRNSDNDIRFLPVECVYSVIEIKSWLDKRQLTKEHSGVFQNMLSVRKLEKKAFYPDGVITHGTTNYGREWTDWPINYFVFAFDSIGLSTLKDHINDYHIQNSLLPEKRIDCVCIIGKGVVLNKDTDDTFSACPTSNSGLVYIESQKELLLFYTLISHYLLQTEMRTFRFIDYVRNLEFGTAF